MGGTSQGYLVSCLKNFDEVPVQWLLNIWLNYPSNRDIIPSRGNSDDCVTQHIMVWSSQDPMFVFALCWAHPKPERKWENLGRWIYCYWLTFLPRGNIWAPAIQPMVWPVYLCLPSFSLLAFSLQGKAATLSGRRVDICLICIWSESCSSHSWQLYCAVFRIIILKWFISEADLGKLGHLHIPYLIPVRRPCDGHPDPPSELKDLFP